MLFMCTIVRIKIYISQSTGLPDSQMRRVVMHVYDDINVAAVHESDKNIIHEY